MQAVQYRRTQPVCKIILKLVQELSSVYIIESEVNVCDSTGFCLNEKLNRTFKNFAIHRWNDQNSVTVHLNNKQRKDETNEMVS